MNRSNQIESKNIQDILALTPMQEGLLFHYLQALQETPYFNQLSLELSGDINLKYFKEAWNFVLESNEMLRTVFRWEKLEKPTQIVLKRHNLHLRYEDLSSPGNNVEPQKQWETIKQQDRSSQFDLRQVPFRVILGKMSQNHYQMLISNHHILYDGWSTGIILKEFFQAFETLASGNQPLVPRVKSGFKEFIRWLQDQDRLEQKKFWQNYLEGFDTPTRLPVKRSQPGPGSPGKSNYRMHLSMTVKDKLDAFFREKRITLAAVFYSAWGILLQKYCGLEDVVFGITVSGRSASIKGIEDMVGLFINTIPLRARFEHGEGLLDFLVRINNHLAASEKYENTSLVDIYIYCRQFTRVREELFDTLVSIENYPMDTYLREPGSHLSIQSYEMEERPHYDLTLVISAGKGIDIDFIYNNSSFAKETIVRLAHHFGTIIKGIGENIENRPQEIQILSDEEKQQLLVDFNRTAAAYPGEKGIHELFAGQVERTPDHVALIGPKLQNTNYKQSGALRADVDAFGEAGLRAKSQELRAVTYKELNERTGQVAGRLLEKGVLPGDITAIMVKRSPEMVIGILGILKANGAYLPIDPDYPQERIEYMLKDSGAKALVTTPGWSEKFKELLIVNCQLLIVNEIPHGRRRLNNPPKEANLINNYQLTIYNLQLEKSNLAYILYTSGSTGWPKGVMIEHGPVVNLLFSLQRRYPLREQDTYLLKTSYLFDVSVTELFGWFLEGGRLAVLEPGGEKDPKAIVEMIVREGVTHINFVPSMFHMFVEILDSQEIVKLSGLKYIFLAGEALLPGPVNRFRCLNTSIAIENLYGPTEAAVYASWYSLADRKGETSIPIGKPLPNVTLYIFDKWGYLQPLQVPGELCIGGQGLARGYLNNPDLTIDRFLSIFNRSYRSYMTYIPKRLYHTGDLARWLLDGNIEFLGRMDHQVKIRGFRVELGEIENQLMNHEDIKEAVVFTRENPGSDNQLCAFIIPGRNFAVPELKAYLAGKLPGYMIPSYFKRIEKLPLTPNGKVDRKALAASTAASDLETGVDYIPPKSEIEKTIAGIWKELLGLEKVSVHDNFFDIGGNSLTIIRLNSRLKKAFKKDIPIASVFNYPTIASMATHLSKEEKGESFVDIATHRTSTGETGKKGNDIAVIGMAGRFPGAKNLDEFWDNLKQGVESISFFTQEQLKQLGVDAQLINNPDYVPAKGVLESKEYFDSFFFDYTPAEAEILDPQVRIFHECTWEALENAGYDPFGYEGAVGLYAGASPNPLWEISPLTSRSIGNSYPELWNAIQFSDKDYLGTRLAYKLDLKGPCITMQTACSTSLAAVDQSCRALVSGACSIALAGGVSITLQDEGGYLYQEGTIMSPDGHCRAFDAGANGTVGGNGVGVIVLKRLAEAVTDRDTIYAVIKGFAINNDGKNKVCFTAPSSSGQAKVIRDALDMAGVNPESIGYIETHGTGTLLGDPIEIEGLKLAFNTAGFRKKHYCALGSVKTNIGHLDAAAGIAGFIKTVLSLHHRFIPPSLNFKTPNPQIDFENSPFYVNTTLKTWESNEYPLRAGVSSFGLGGTNVHVVMEEAPAEIRDNEGTGGLAPLPAAPSPAAPSPAAPLSNRQYQLILLSAKTPRALDKMSGNLARHFERNPGIELADAAYTLQTGRKSFTYRKMLVGSDLDEAIRKLDSGEVETARAKEEKPTVIFMFSGQGSQYVNMGHDLYQNEPRFRRQIDECFELLMNLTGIDMKPVLYPDQGTITGEEAEEKIFQFKYTTPIKFIFEYSLARLLMEWGIRPDAMIGHSFGEYAAACLSGVFSLEHGLFLAALRGELMDGLPDGAMLSVPLSEKELKQRLKKEDELSIAAVNAESLCVVSGPVGAVNRLEEQLDLEGHECLRFRVPKAGHSHMVEPIMEEFKKKIGKVKFHQPQIPFISCISGTWITAEEAADPGYWTRHLREPVRFADGLTTLFKEPNPVFLQASPGKGLILFISQHPDKKNDTLALSMVRHRKEPVSDLHHTLTQIGRLWLNGCAARIDWQAFYEDEKRRRIPLPSYPFEPLHYPVNRDLFQPGTPVIPSFSKETEPPGWRKKPDSAEWFYVPSWERVMLPSGTAIPQGEQPHHTPVILLFMDNCGLGSRMKERLEQDGTGVITVDMGITFKKSNDRAYTLNPSDKENYNDLLRELAAQGEIPSRVCHLWSLTRWDRDKPAKDNVDQALDRGFYSLLFLVQALGKQNIKTSQGIRLEVVTGSALEVSGDEELNPASAPVYGLCRVIPQEYPDIDCRCIDIPLPLPPGNEIGQKQVRQLWAEISAGSPERVTAYRGDYRWVETFKPFRLEKSQPGALPLKPGGVYMITGGLGAIGLVLAQYLARTFKARLILTGRSDFPPRQEWEREKVSRKVQRLLEMEEAGAEVLVMKADVSSLEQMQAVFQQGEEKFGPINGVIHAAGIVGEKSFCSLGEMGRTEAQLHFEPKVYGLLVLAEILKNRPVDFCLLMSSTASVLGGMGFGAYSAANRFMDTYIYWLARSGRTRWISVNWDGWLLEEKQIEDTALGTEIKELVMTPPEGVEVFQRILAWPEARQVIECTGNLQSRIDRWVKMQGLRLPDQEKGTRGKKPGPVWRQPRPHLANPYLPPQSSREKQVAGIWEDLLSYEHIGIRDNFFELNGDSLKAVIAISKIHKQAGVKIPLKDFFSNPTVEGITQYIDRTGVGRYYSIQPMEKKEYYPLSSAQEGMFILNRYEEERESTAYNIPAVMELVGELDRERFHGVFPGLIHRHESLRTSFLVIEDRPVQRIHENVELEIEYDQVEVKVKIEKERFEGTRGLAPLSNAPLSEEPAARSPKSQELRAKSFISSFIRPFDLSRAPLFRVGLIKLLHTPAALRDHPSIEGKKDRYLLMVDMHHIVSDGTSMGVLVKDFMQLYEGGGKTLQPLSIQYKDYACWQKSERESERVKRQESYWQQELAGEIPVLELPFDYDRPVTWDFEGRQLWFELGKEETRGLKELARAGDVTLYMVLVSIYMILLSRLSGQEEIIIGAPAAGRRHWDMQNVIGIFVNTLVLLGFVNKNKSYREWLEELKPRVLAAFENQDYPFEELVEQKLVHREVGRNPLFDVSFVLQNMEIPGMKIPGLELKPSSIESTSAKLDLALIAEEKGESLWFTFEYRVKLFRPGTVERFSRYFKQAVREILKSPGQRIGDIEIIPVEERRRLLEDFNDTCVEYPRDKTLHQLFAEQVEQTPDRIALVGAALRGCPVCLTYRQLDEQSGRLAGLLAEKGLWADNIVGLMLERSLEMIIGILGILKAGGAYLPIDPDYPQERIEYMLKDSKAKALVTTPGLSEKFEELLIVNCQLLIVNEMTHGRRRLNNPPKEANSINNYQLTIYNLQLEKSNLAYILYTSGSTGRPKGVMVQHGNVVRLVKNPSFIEAKEGQRLLMTGMFTFDIVTFEIWWPLLNGLSLYQADKNTILDPEEMEKIITMNRIDILHLVPQVFNQLFSHHPGIFAGLSYFLVGGDLVQPRDIRQLRAKYEKLKILHMYGPTESTTFSTYLEVDQVGENDRTLPIGKPVNNSSVYILGRHDELLPIGAAGQLCLGGPGVARGYLNNPELTAEKFCSPLNRSYRSYKTYIPKKLYKTGDLARWLENGNLEFLGRIDFQVKIRGNRIEVAEIENRLLNYKGIKDAVVSAFTGKNGNKYLSAFIVTDYEIEVSLLREFLLKYLPDYMIPSYFVKLDKIPLNANGKINRKALPAPGENFLEDKIECIPPQNPVEKILVEIWEKVLGRLEVGINQNFFAIGGDSIKSIQIISRMSRAGYKLEMKDLFQYPVISDLAPRVKKLQRIPEQSVITGTIPLTPIQEMFFNESYRAPHHYNQAVMLHSKEGFDQEAIKEVFTRVQQHHDALRMTFQKDEDQGKIIQVNHGLEYPLYLEEHDLSSSENSSRELETKANRIHASIHLEKGPLLKLGLYHLNDGDRLLIVIHHLVMDGVSWRILLEDIETLYSLYKQGKKLVLPLKTDSFKLWSEKLSAYTNSKTFLKEKTYWQKIESIPAPLIPKDFPGDDNYSKDTEGVSFTLTKEQTGLLLTKVNEAFRTEINDILLTALSLGIKKTFGLDKVLAALEGHGREEITEEIDISRTVGWFTSVYPVLMDVSYAQDPGRQIKEIKETLRRVPNKGIGCGILKHLTGKENKKEIQFKLKPQISFNYMGQWEAQPARLSSFEIAKESTGNLQAANNQREYLLDVVGMIADNRLTMTILYNKTHFKPGTVSTLLDNLETGLKHIIEFCCSRKKTEPTPGDFTYKGLSIESVDRLMESYPNAEDLYTLTPMQEGMLFHALEDEASYSYFEQISFRLQGELDIDRVEKSLNELFKRRDILRTAFVYKNIEPPVQVVLKERAIDFYYQDISKINEPGEKKNIIKEFKEKDKQRSFDLTRDVLMRVAIFRTEESQYEFIWSCHHILMDGWCLGIINNEFFEIYTSYLDNRPYRLPGVKPYRNYIQWLEKQDKEESARYWENYLDSFEEQTGIPQKNIPGKEVNTYRNETVSLVFDKEKTAGLNRLAARNHVTLNIVTQTLWGILLGKYNGKEDVVFGAVVSGRPYGLEGVETMVGLFINAVPVRIRYVERMKFNRLLQKVQAEALACEPYHYHPLAEIQAGTTLKQNLIDHLFEFENYPVAEQIEGYGRGKNKSNQTSFQPTNVEVFEQTNYDFNVTLSGSEQLSIGFQYNGIVYDQDFVERIAKHFSRLFDQVVENRELEVRELTLLAEEEKNRILYEFNDTAAAYPGDKTLHRLFEEQVEETPDFIAIIGPSVGAINESPLVQITYKELNERANRLAGLLIEKGIQPDTLVGIMVERSVEMVVGILGIWKSGAAYLPIDPDSPQERIDYMLKDSGAEILLKDNDLTYLPSSTLLPFYPSSPFNLAYVIYTSGSTGKPKGAIVEHRGMMNHISAKINDLRISANSVVAQNASHTFDISVWQFFAALAQGGRTVIYPGETVLKPERFITRLMRDGITILEVVPSYLSVILSTISAGDFAHLPLEYLLVTGEEVKPHLVKQWFEKYPGIKMVNAYGPTEASDDITHYIMEKAPNTARIPIGKPLQNFNIYILAENMELCPIGIKGEICVAGIGVGRGYLNNPGLTAEKFFLLLNRNNRSYKSYRTYTSKKIYKTGDLGRWNPDGTIEFFGRKDYQVKIRGFRVELEEIEKQILNYSTVKEAVVIDKEDEHGNKYLCAYMTGGGKSIAPRLKDYLAKRLPNYMVPAFFLELDKIPLTPNGKIDRKGLPDPGGIGLKNENDYIPPSGAVEKKLVEIWEKVLGKKDIGINENFFMIGGDSIKSIQIMSRMNRAGYKLEMKDIFQYPVISELAPHVKKLQRIPDQSTITGTIPLTPIQQAFFKESYREPHHYNQSVMFYSQEGFDKEALKKIFGKIQEHHDALRMTYKIKPGNGEAIQINHGLDYPLSIDEYHLRNRETGLEEFKTRVNQVQASIDLEKGPLMKPALFHLDDGDRLLLVVHHLVIDGVSWRILFEDIETLYSQYKRGEKLQLPAKTDSFKLWSEKLSAYANSKTFLKEKTYWQKLETIEVPPILKDFPVDDDDVKDTGGVSFTLEEEETRNLLTKVNETFATEINDILLTALGMGIKKTFGPDRVLAALEGHGRVEIPGGIDISRTVGWFTSVYPVVMDISYAGDPGRQIKEIKETLRQIPNKGIGYGILKYLTREENKKEIQLKLEPQIGFNYLGQFDADVNQRSSFEIAKESTGNSQGLNNRREYLLEVSGVITDNRLTMTISFNKTHFKPGTMSTLIRNFQSELTSIIIFCSSKENPELTPSDFTYKELTKERLQHLLEVYPEIEDIYTLSPMQAGMLFHAVMDRTSYSYFEQAAFRFQGELDLPMVRKSLNELVKRHDILRTAFVHKDTPRPLQVVLKTRPIDFYYEDISQIGKEEEKKNFTREFKTKDKKRSFDLSKDVLMRVSILQTAPSQYEFIWSFHHILMDGWCIGILNTEFFDIYIGYLENRPYRLPAVKPYRTYIQWLEKQDKEEAARYWQNYLDSYEEPAGVPGKKRLTKEENPTGYRNDMVSIVLEMQKITGLNKLAARNHVTLNTITQTLWGVLLGKYNGKDDVVFGAVVSGRPYELEGVESMVGLFINTIPVRIRFEKKMKFDRLLQKVQENAVRSEPHHYHPLAEIQSLSPLKQNLIDHIMVFENYPIAEQIEGYGRERNTNSHFPLKITDIDVFEQTNYDFNVVLGGSNQIKITFQYNGNVYDEGFIEKIAKHFILAVDQVIENPGLEVRELTLLAKEEKNRILYKFNDTAAAYPADKTIHRLFEEQVERSPDRIALLGPDDQGAFLKNRPLDPQKTFYCLTYRELNAQSNGLAYLLIEKGVRPDTIVGIMMERSLDMIVGMMGILKAGGAYLPIDPDYPEERIEYMVKDSSAKILVSDHLPSAAKNLFEKRLPDFQKFFINEKFFGGSRGAISQKSPPGSANLAYIIYTSGTTGQPKGSLIEHRNVVRLMFNDKFQFDFSERDVWTLFHSYCFDFSVWEMYGALLYGGKLVIVPKMTARDTTAFLELLNREAVTVLNQTPPAFYNLINEALSPQEQGKKLYIKYVIFGGEALNPLKLENWLEKYPQTRLINMFGITETTVHVTYKEITEKEIKLNISNIGKPIPTLSTYILDQYLEPVPIGVTGEICVGGDGVARGYLNQVELAEKKFTENPYPFGRRLYRSGDKGRFLENGDMEYLGRIDNQVKIRGFRVELGEIEHQLLSQEGIKAAAVILMVENEENYLSAYFTSDKNIEIPGLRDNLAKKLPYYMIPSYFNRIGSMPLTPNGKIDRKTLALIGHKSSTGIEFVAPQNETEKKVAAVWKEVLGVEQVGIYDNFFNIGGNSLKVMALSNKLKEVLGTNISVAKLFEHVTIDAFVRYYTGEETRGNPPGRIMEKSKTTAEVKKSRERRKERRR